MLKREIDKTFVMRIVSEEKWYPATVPGSVYGDLLANGAMEDPYWKDNELKALEIMKEDFEYVGVFDGNETILNQEKVYLHFNGIDTLADIYLNNSNLGSVNNMHREWEFDVTDIIRQNGNELRILFHSPTRYIEEEYQKEKIGGTEDAMRGFSKLRKAHCMFGWDWGPRLPDAGIWREIYLIGVTGARFNSVTVTQRHEQEGVYLGFKVLLDRIRDNSLIDWEKYEKELKEEGFSLRITVTDLTDESCRTVRLFHGKTDEILIENPRLWWPNGYGEQNLYAVLVQLLKHDEEIDSWEKRIGLRTLTVLRTRDEFGESFAHEVNGITFFAMGADYIPEDCILSRCNEKRTRDLLNQCREANFNVIRVWGGGHYPYDSFWDICDELGLVVWQDFMFACANYDLTEEFEENIRRELIDNIRRIRHHPSLGLWCGNNEMEMFADAGIWESTPRHKADYIKLYEYIIPKILKEEDPQTFYWPASPSSGGSFDNPNDENRGDVHYWDVWHGNKPITEYRKFYFRYVSEFGFQSFPSLKTVETFTEEEDRNVFSYVMEKHQRNSTANGKIMNYMEQTFLYPGDFDTLLYASQLLQAEAIRYGVEHFRRNRGRCMGAIVWQLNDCWPVASWSSIDYCERWKALHYYEKRFFAPLMISCEEEGILTQDPNPNAQPYEVMKSIRLCVSNERRKDERVTAIWELRKNTGEIVRSSQEEYMIPKLSSLWFEKVSLQEASLYEDYVSYQMEQDGEIVSQGTVLFCPPKHYHFIDPELSVRSEGDSLVVTAKAYARSVEIRNKKDDLVLSDNYFDMNPGERRVKILKGLPEELTVRSVYNIR
ncbi:glycoside hydrolase family 2 protein [Clostridium boliviensis]|uniref:Beta-mannosidase B n=2 Tax=Bacillota TaxID=1239 RepID=A0ABU4GIE9_9CLOT|nr:glycoside hydrolase family 2 protein [Clostridium boliviensis]MDW2796770.1 glycoside hydrolase family 2 protein [Clostridium boliviensis]